jgi:hypothetical protein
MTVRVRLLLAVGAIAIAAMTGAYTWAAFVGTAANDSNSISTGTVSLTDNDATGAMLALSGAVPGQTDTGCLRVRYNGSLPARVRLYGTTSGTGLDQYLNVTITRGVYSPSEPAFESCTNFQADTADYIGAGAGVIYSGTLQAFPDNYAGGIVDATAGSPESWTGTEDHVYRIQVTLQNDIAAEGLDANQTFTWEARNE